MRTRRLWLRWARRWLMASGAVGIFFLFVDRPEANWHPERRNGFSPAGWY